MSNKTGNGIEKIFEFIWYKSRFTGYLLLPISAIFFVLSLLRKKYLLSSLTSTIDKPIIIVGNISVGGTGKTPLVVALVEYLKSQGLKPGVVSRGYGGNADYPYQLDRQTSAAQSGDEPLLIYQRCACPVVVSPDRVQAAEYLLANNTIDIIISDDGLQHYALPRQMEIAVVDGERGLGNGLCLPAGPLRETAGRLQSVDMVVVNGGSRPCNENPLLSSRAARLIDGQVTMQLKTQTLRPLVIPSAQPMPEAGARVNAVAAIGNPGRFYAALEYLGFKLIEHSYPDHYQYSEQELIFANNLPVIMTEKDAVKCNAYIGLDNHWFLPVNAVMPEAFWQVFDEKVNRLVRES